MAKEIEVPHPEFGKVVFTEPTGRQEDILKEYVKYYNRYNGIYTNPAKRKKI